MRVGHVGQSGGHTRNEHEPHSAAQASWNEAHGALPLYFNPRVTPRPVPLPQGQSVHVLFFPPFCLVTVSSVQLLPKTQAALPWQLAR